MQSNNNNTELVLINNGESEILGTFNSEKAWEIFEYLKDKFSGTREHVKEALRLEFTLVKKNRNEEPLSLSDFCYFETSAYDEIKRDTFIKRSRVLDKINSIANYFESKIDKDIDDYFRGETGFRYNDKPRNIEVSSNLNNQGIYFALNFMEDNPISADIYFEDFNKDVSKNGWYVYSHTENNLEKIDPIEPLTDEFIKDLIDNFFE